MRRINQFDWVRRLAWFGCAFFAPLFIVSAAAEPVPAIVASPAPAADSRWEFVEPHMGTLFQIVIFAREIGPAKSAARAAFDRIAELNRIMSDYDPNSELMRLCRQPSGRAAPVSAELAEILQRSQRLAERSSGAFDVTVGPVIALWREARRTRQLPAKPARDAALVAVGFKKLQVDAAKNTVTLLAPGMRLDLGGIAKGYAADAALSVLAQRGFRRAMVAASGDLALGDPPPGAVGWRVELGADGAAAGKPVAIVAANVGISTSGDAEQFVEIGGTRYSHIVDPATGLGLTRSVTVTVVARDATASDSLATACSVMPPEQAKRFIEDSPDPIRVMIETRDAEGLAQRHTFGSNPPGVTFPL